jgi:hypothetical protein
MTRLLRMSHSDSLNEEGPTDVVRYTARAGESVPIELDGTEHGQVAVVDLIARQA